MESTPLVTICIATYNRMHLLPQTVASVLQQSYQNIEVLIVNDCSPDDTISVIEGLLIKDSRVRAISHETNKGLAAARNTAIFNAKGKYFTFIDDDDEWQTDYVSKFVQLAENYDDQWCFCCGYSTTDAIGQSIFRKFNHMEGALINYVREGYTPPVASQFYFTSTLQRIGGYHENVKSGVDHDLWLSLAFAGVKLKSLDEYLSKPSEVMTVGRGKMTNTFDKRIKGINGFLSVWKEELTKNFGQEFYQQFVNAYNSREKKKFFRLYLFKFKVMDAIQLYKRLDEKLPVKELLKILFIVVIYHLRIPVKREKHGIIGPGLQIG